MSDLVAVESPSQEHVLVAFRELKAMLLDPAFVFDEYEPLQCHMCMLQS